MTDPVLILFIALAGFLTYKLFSVLGTRGGHEPSDAERAAAARAARGPATDEQPTAQPVKSDKPLPPWAQTVAEHYPAFDPDEFLTGARAAYEMIVQAYAKGDLGEVRRFIDPDVLRTFEVAVDGRRGHKQTMEVTFVGIESADVVESRVVHDQVEVEVAFKSDQIRVVRDAEGEIIDGDPNRIDLVRDQWTFARPTSSQDPNWTLVATDGA